MVALICGILFRMNYFLSFPERIEHGKMGNLVTSKMTWYLNCLTV